MGKVLRGISIVLKAVLFGVLLIGHIAANVIGLLVCAITSEG